MNIGLIKILQINHCVKIKSLSTKRYIFLYINIIHNTYSHNYIILADRIQNLEQ